MTRTERERFRILMVVGWSLTAIFGVWWLQPYHIPENFSGKFHFLDFILFAALTYIVWYQITTELFSWYISASMKRPVLPPVPEVATRVALLTAFVPGKEPYDVLERTLRAMKAVHYEHDTWVLDEGNDPETIRLCRLYNAKHFSRNGIAKYNTAQGKYKAKTKAGNYNAWFTEHGAEYDIVGQHDVDFVPNKNFFMRTLGYFTDPNVAFVGTPQIYGNTDESWIARGAAEQAYGFFGPTQKGLYGHDMSLFIGANHIIRVSAHDDIEGYSGHIVEDHLTGMRMYANNWKSVYVPEILAVGEGPATWDAYFSQQMRWAHGLIDILFKHSPTIFPRMQTQHRANYFMLQQYYFYGLAQMIGIALISLYFLFGIQSTAMELLPLLSLYLPLLAWQLVIFFWLQKFYIDPKNESGLLWRGRLLNTAVWPIYFLALIGVLMGKKINYVVTPKGSSQISRVPVSLFIPHFVLGTTTLIGLFVGVYLNNMAAPIVFWAMVNTFFMYFFFFNAVMRSVWAGIRAFRGFFLRGEMAA